MMSKSYNGIFTVKSAYHIARIVLGKETYHMNQRNPWRKALWQVKIMPKIKYFIWSLIHGFIPVGSELLKRGIQMNNVCPVCGSQEESLFHIFFDCELSSTVLRNWFQDGIPVNQSLWGGVQGWNMLFQWLKQKDEVDTWVIICWQLWNNRNQCLHKLSCRRPMEMIKRIEAIREKGRSRPAITREQIVVYGWQAPLEDDVKLNVDAAFFPHRIEATLGMVLRDHTGSILLSAVKRVGEVECPLQAELLAILFGLEECRSQLLQSLIIESDSLLAVREIEIRHESFSERFSIILDIIHVAQHYTGRQFCHISRLTNKCAHMLTKIPCHLGDYKIWKNSLSPSFCNPNLS